MDKEGFNDEHMIVMNVVNIIVLMVIAVIVDIIIGTGIVG